MTAKVYTLRAMEDWIVDRFVSEWSADNADMSTDDIHDASVVWLLASWCWRRVPADILAKKTVLATVHHIVPDKFDSQKRREFLERDQYVSAYHVYNQVTHDVVCELTHKPVHLVPYWANQRIWHQTGTKKDLRKKFSLSSEAYIIGSFQRDTEGTDLVSPKLEKGPDLLIDFIERMSSRRPVHVVLAGWRRQYVMSRLNEMGIKYTYFELPSQQVVNELYQTLDLYPVTSRYEGGPQSLIECGLIGVPVVSRDVGIARQVLPDDAIRDDVSDASPYVPNVNKWILPEGYLPYRRLLSSLNGE